METASHIFSAFLAIVFLWRGADWLVDAASRIATRLRVSDLVIGLTLVAAGTSAPEFAVSIEAALEGRASISVGNIIGSNIFNLGFILGGCAMLKPILTSRPLVYRDGAVLLGITILLSIFLSDSELTRVEGGIMVTLLVAYLLWLFKTGILPEDEKAEEAADGDAVCDESDSESGSESGSESDNGDITQSKPVSTEKPPEGWWNKPNLVDFGIVLLGFVLVVGGSRMLVFGASGIARTFGMSEWAIGLTIIAAGTSAPELVTTVAATLKSRHGISAGALVGSDIYNLLGVLGIASLIEPMRVADVAQNSTWLLVAMVTLVLIFMRTGWRLGRVEGAILILINLVRWWYDLSLPDA